MSSWYFIDTDQNTGFPQTSREWNALVISDYFRAQGWTYEAIAGMLGNMEVESFLNPCQWEIGHGKSMTYGFGLVQWTPATKYTNWAGADWRTNFDLQLYRIQYEYDNGLQWQPNYQYDYMTFADFAHSTQSASYLAGAFLYSYEIPQDPSASIAIRQANANRWYTYLTGSPTPPDPPPPTPGGGNIPIWMLFKIRWKRRGAV